MPKLKMVLAAAMLAALLLAAGAFARNRPQLACSKQLVIGVYVQPESQNRTDQIFQALGIRPLYSYGKYGFAAWLTASQRLSLQKLTDLVLVENGGRFIVGLRSVPAGTNVQEIAQSIGITPDYSYTRFAGFTAQLSAAKIVQLVTDPHFSLLKPETAQYQLQLNLDGQPDPKALESELAARYGFKVDSDFFSPANPAAGYGALADVTAYLNPFQLAGLDSSPQVRSLSFAATGSTASAVLRLPKPVSKCR